MHQSLWGYNPQQADTGDFGNPGIPE